MAVWATRDRAEAAEAALADWLYSIRSTRDQMREMGNEKWDWDSLESVLGMNMALLGHDSGAVLREMRAPAKPTPGQRARLDVRFR